MHREEESADENAQEEISLDNLADVSIRNILKLSNSSLLRIWSAWNTAEASPPSDKNKLLADVLSIRERQNKALNDMDTFETSLRKPISYLPNETLRQAAEAPDSLTHTVRQAVQGEETTEHELSTNPTPIAVALTAMTIKLDAAQKALKAAENLLQSRSLASRRVKVAQIDCNEVIPVVTPPSKRRRIISIGGIPIASSSAPPDFRSAIGGKIPLLPAQLPEYAARRSSSDLLRVTSIMGPSILYSLMAGVRVSKHLSARYPTGDQIIKSPRSRTNQPP